MADEESTYLEERAETELALAQAAAHPAAVRAHYLLAAHYLDQLYSKCERPAHSNNNESVSG